MDPLHHPTTREYAAKKIHPLHEALKDIHEHVPDPHHDDHDLAHTGMSGHDIHYDAHKKPEHHFAGMNIPKTHFHSELLRHPVHYDPMHPPVENLL